MELKIKIIGTGIKLPQTKVSSAQLERQLNLKPGSIVARVGVENRYFAEEELGVDLSAAALSNALENAGMAPEDLDAIISASASFFQTLPSNAAMIHSKMKLPPRTVAFDVDSTCLSFLTALDMVSYVIAAGRFKNVAIVSSETPSKVINWQDEETATLFGDGAAAVIVTGDSSSGTSKIFNSLMMTYSEGLDFCKVEGGGTHLPVAQYNASNKAQYCFEMDGPKVFRVASKHFLPFVSDLLEPNKFSVSDLDIIIPHQASLLAVKHLQKKIQLRDEQLIVTLPKYGNTVAASIPMALHEGIESKRIRRGAKVMMIGTSAGLSIGGMILEY